MTKAVKQASGNAAAFVDLVESRADAAMDAFKILLNRYIFGNGGGSLGVIESRTATTITLTQRSAMNVFHRSSQIQPATTDGLSGSVINDIQTVTQVDRPAERSPCVRCDANYRATNQVFIRGGFGNVRSACMGSWNPLGSGFDAHFGVNRTLDSMMYAQIRTATMLGDDSSFEEALISLDADVTDAGGIPKYMVMTRGCTVLIKQLGSR